MTTLPPHIAESITRWAADHKLSPNDAADVVRTVVSATATPGMVGVNGSKLITTTLPTSPAGNTTFALALPLIDMEVLEYRMPFHPNGTICSHKRGCGDWELATVTVGESKTIGDWVWGAGDKALAGVFVGGTR